MGTIKDKIQQQKREEYAYKKMLDYGWQPHQASAIVGNLKRESNFNTTVVGTADDKGSQGVAQWHSGRLDNLKKKYGSNWTDFDNQLDFVNWELNNSHKKAGDALRQTKGVWDAGRVVTDKYEAPKVKWDRDEKRQTYVTDNYRKYSGIQLTDEDRANFLKGTAQRAIDNYNATQTTPTIVTDFAVPQQNSNLASVTETEEVASAKEELQQKQNEENFIADLFANSQQQEEVIPQQQIAPIAQTNALEKYAQIESFVDSEVLQEGGKIPISSRGMYEFPNQKVIIPSPNITMKNIPHKIKGISLETGEEKIMTPENNYFFKNTKNVLELPWT